jgi:hypothetical protein
MDDLGFVIIEIIGVLTTIDNSLVFKKIRTVLKIPQ